MSGKGTPVPARRWLMWSGGGVLSGPSFSVGYEPASDVAGEPPVARSESLWIFRGPRDIRKAQTHFWVLLRFLAYPITLVTGNDPLAVG